MSVVRGTRVAFTGKVASGKTTAALILAEELLFARMALADELKSLAREIADWIELESVGIDIFYDLAQDMKDKTTPVGRRWLQWLGTDALRRRLPDIWIQMLLRKIECLPRTMKIAVDDVRFINEAEGLRKEGFVIIGLVVPYDVRRRRVETLYPQYRGRTVEIESHPSETEVDSIRPDVTIEAEEGLPAFRRQIVDAVTSLNL